MISPSFNKLTEGLKKVEAISSILRENDDLAFDEDSFRKKEREKEEKRAIQELLTTVIDPEDKDIKDVAESTLISHTTGLDGNFTELMCLHEQLTGRGIELQDILESMRSYALQQSVKTSSPTKSCPLSVASFPSSVLKPVVVTFHKHEYPLLFDILLRWRLQFDAKDVSTSSISNMNFVNPNALNAKAVTAELATPSRNIPVLRRTIRLHELASLHNVGDEKGLLDTFESITVSFDNAKNIATLYMQQEIDRTVYQSCLLEACRQMIIEAPKFFPIICHIYHQLMCPHDADLYEAILKPGQAYLKIPPATSLKFFDVMGIIESLHTSYQGVIEGHSLLINHYLSDCLNITQYGPIFEHVAYTIMAKLVHANEKEIFKDIEVCISNHSKSAETEPKDIEVELTNVVKNWQFPQVVLDGFEVLVLHALCLADQEEVMDLEEFETPLLIKRCLVAVLYIVIKVSWLISKEGSNSDINAFKEDLFTSSSSLFPHVVFLPQLMQCFVGLMISFIFSKSSFLLEVEIAAKTDNFSSISDIFVRAYLYFCKYLISSSGSSTTCQDDTRHSRISSTMRMNGIVSLHHLFVFASNLTRLQATIKNVDDENDDNENENDRHQRVVFEIFWQDLQLVWNSNNDDATNSTRKRTRGGVAKTMRARKDDLSSEDCSNASLFMLYDLIFKDTMNVSLLQSIVRF